VVVYIRYSKVHARNQCFYGLRKKDLQALEGRRAILCFLWDEQKEPLIIPFAEYEEIFHSVEPADDGQYKVQIYLEDQGVQLYVPKAGRFNVERFFGWDALEAMAGSIEFQKTPDLTHPQVQILLGSIGTTKGYEIWIPQIDRVKT